jgi:hypothetical protein
MSRSVATLMPARFAASALIAISFIASACGGGGTPTIATATQGPVTSSAPVATSSGGVTVDTATLCRDLTNLKSLDYAFGASFSIMQSLDASGKALTLQHLTTFAAKAPAELKTAVTDLIAVWTALAADPNSVSSDDARITSATQAITGWISTNCT